MEKLMAQKRKKNFYRYLALLLQIDWEISLLDGNSMN